MRKIETVVISLTAITMLVAFCSCSPNPVAQVPGNESPSAGPGGNGESNSASSPNPDLANKSASAAHDWKDDRFLNSKNCALCHSNSERATAMRDAQDRPVAPYDLWQASMMANSSRDPFWRAVLSAEVAATPSIKAKLEEKCTRCHAPMAAPAPESPPGELIAHIRQDDQRSHLGLDGVSCTVCHQITDTGLGTAASFTGHFEINDERKIFGPHADPVTMPMRRHVNYTPTEGDHILKSGMCATCHTVMTHSVDASGQPTAPDEFHEQSPYLEWRNSVFNDEVDQPANQARSCQSCHMPVNDEDGKPIATRLAHNPGGRDFPFLKPRRPFGRHAFLGGNYLLKRILRDNAEALEVVASREAFDQSIEQTVEFLATETGQLEIGEGKVEAGKLRIPVTVKNLSGHKLPTAYPSRRVWIQLSVKTAAGETVFESGNFNERGQLLDAQGNVQAFELADGPISQHHQTINDPDQVQVYEAIMGDAESKPTFTLMRGATYAKDNRLLPQGWQAEHADGPATKPFGIDGDTDFVGGSDTVLFQVPVNDGASYTVSAKLWFQVIAPRHAAELFQFQTPEVETFKALFEQADCRPEVVASVTKSVGG